MDDLRKEADEKINNLIEGKYYTKVALSQILGISYPTLYDRLDKKNWFGKEIDIIMGL